MRTLKRLSVAVAAGTLAASPLLAQGLLTGSAAAAPTPGAFIWAKCATTDVSVENRPDAGDCDPSAVSIQPTGKRLVFTGPQPANVEALTFPVEVEAGDVVSFFYQGECAGGAPRVYVTIDGQVYNTADATQPCGTDAGNGWKKVTYPLPVGGTPQAATVGGWDVAAAGVVVDNGAEGTITVRTVKIGSKHVDFYECLPGQSPSPTVTASASVSPSATMSASASASASTSASPSASASASATVSPSSTMTASASASVGASASATVSPQPEPSVSTSPVAGDLPVTGGMISPFWTVVGVSMVLVGLGLLLALRYLRREEMHLD